MRNRRLIQYIRFLFIPCLVASAAVAAQSVSLALASLSPGGAALEAMPHDSGPSGAAAGRASAAASGRGAGRAGAYPVFPALYDPEVAAAEAGAREPRPLDRERFEVEKAIDPPVLANNQILAFYGKPGSRSMGILGEYPKERLVPLLRGYAKLYDEANGEAGVIPALYIIYGTCWPEGEIGYLAESVIIDYIEFAAREGLLVFVDHQIGKYGVASAMDRLLPYLKYPNVHLALDPEWRTTAPMREIGSVTADEINAAQAMMRDYLEDKGIPGTKMLVVHQFKPKMIASRDRVRADCERVTLVHTADGFGSPALKRLSYAENARADNLPIKGFKLFFKTNVTGAGFDEPLLTPPEVLALDPEPSLVIYQ
jgi:hypothetical protein